MKNEDGAFVFECTGCGNGFPRDQLVEVEGTSGMPMLGRIGVAPPMLTPTQSMVSEAALYCRPCHAALDSE